MLRQQSASEGKASYVGHSHNPCLHSDHQCQDQVDILLHDGFYGELSEVGGIIRQMWTQEDEEEGEGSASQEPVYMR